MQLRTNLGMSIGQMLASGVGGNDAFRQGQRDGYENQYRQAATKKLLADAADQEFQNNARSDDGIARTLLAGIGADSEDGLRDFKATLAGNYQPPTRPLAFTDGGTQLPAPDYVSRFPEAQQKYSTLKQMIALGDKNISNLQKSIQGDQRNAITANLGTATPQEAAVIGQRTAALEGNVNPLEMQKAALTFGLTHGDNSLEAQNALLLSQGKSRYDNTGDVGTMDLLTGLQKLNLIGTTEADKSKGQAAQAYAGAKENNAQAGLANVRANSIKVGRGDGSHVMSRDMSQIRNDIRRNYYLEYPISKLTGRRPKNAPAFDDYESQQIEKYNINKGDYYRIDPFDFKTLPLNEDRTSPRKTPEEIRSEYRSGKISRAQAETALKQLGFN
ncbi:hypothetical protein [Methylophilus sp. OH31]|uniref:hypothetical protein n=1 Tax=Methylophilus sp. OH31 TaxID=1387312 RepID=UPI00046750F2|nr:hypothetical protein [Methylophilus sp. OH31]